MTKEVLFIFFQTGNRANGGLNSLVEIILSLTRVKPLVLTQKETELTADLRKKGVEVLICPLSEGGKVSKVMNVLKFNRFLLSLIRKRGVRVIHLNDMLALMYSSPVLRMKRGLHAIFNIRDVFEPERSYSGRWKLVNLCKDIIVLSEHMKEELLRRLPLSKPAYWNDHFHVSYSIVDFSRFHTAGEDERRTLRRELGMEDGKKHLLYVATFNIKKNQIGFIENALPALKDSNVVVHFVGDFDTKSNPYAAKCEQLITDDLRPHVRFHGFQKKVENFYKAGDLTIVPTKREGLARCMIESISSGTPVVSFDVASAREILEDRNCGEVVSQGDYGGLVDRIKDLLDNGEKYAGMADHGLKEAHHLFDKPKVVEVYESVYLKKA